MAVVVVGGGRSGVVVVGGGLWVVGYGWGCGGVWVVGCGGGWGCGGWVVVGGWWLVVGGWWVVGGAVVATVLTGHRDRFGTRLGTDRQDPAALEQVYGEHLHHSVYRGATVDGGRQAL